MKLAFRQIIHRKVVWIMLFKYPNLEYTLDIAGMYLDRNTENHIFLQQQFRSLPKLYALNLNFQSCRLGDKKENFQFVLQVLQKFPQLLSLNLNLGFNKFGHDPYNMAYLYKQLKGLKNLRNLNLYLFENLLGDNQLNYKYLFQSFKNMNNMQNLCLNLYSNCLKIDQDNYQYIQQAFKNMKNLENLEFNIFKCNIKNTSIQSIIDSFNYIPQLKYLNLDISDNELSRGNIGILQQLASKFRKLERLDLNLGSNDLGNKLHDLFKDHWNFPATLKIFKLYLRNNQIDEYDETLQILGKAISKWIQLEHLYLDMNQYSFQLDQFQYFADKIRNLQKLKLFQYEGFTYDYDKEFRNKVFNLFKQVNENYTFKI